MTSVTLNEVRRGFYLDSVALMRVARTVAEMQGIEEAALMMGSPANRDLMRDAGILSDDGEGAEPNDLVIAVRAVDRSAAVAALVEAANQIDRPKLSSDAAVWRPKTLRQAAKMAPEANLALISVPGDFAVAEARKALRQGLHAMIFSDNIPVESERALKEEAHDAGLLVMGPDCGTAILGGVPLAFANSVPRGDIGIIGASGTGIQEVSCLIAQNGGGISQAIGVGGRDLSAEVGGITTLMAIDQLDADPATAHIVLISKPPAADVAERVAAHIAKSPKSFTVCFIGSDVPALPSNAVAATTLKGAAMQALGGLEDQFVTTEISSIGDRTVLGLFSGGTLCAEAQIIFWGGGEAVVSNAPVPNAGPIASTGHRFLDLGSDEYTKGRPHPMIDPGVRDTPLAAGLRDPAVGAVLLDIVIGYGAHYDPAGHLGAQLRAQARNETLVIASVTGTDSDPQIRSVQESALRSVGIAVLPSNADAAAYALACLRASE